MILDRSPKTPQNQEDITIVHDHRLRPEGAYIQHSRINKIQTDLPWIAFAVQMEAEDLPATQSFWEAYAI